MRIKKQIPFSVLCGRPSFRDFTEERIRLFSWDEEKKTLYIPRDIFCWESQEQSDLCGILHEQGHAFFSHQNPNDDDSYWDTLIKELEAWSYVFHCTKKEFHREVWKWVYDALESYFEELPPALCLESMILKTLEGIK